MAPRGISAADKRIKMLEIFHETAEFFTLKELEKVAPKTKGIVSQSVKEVLDDLVGDGLVTFDKIGTSNYFWSFPSAAGAMKEAALSKSQSELETLTSRVSEVSAALKEASRGREDTAERQKLLSQLAALRDEHTVLQSELDAFSQADPALYERKKAATKLAKDAALRWTDNSMLVVSYMRGLGFSEEDVRNQFGIGEGWEDLQ